MASVHPQETSARETSGEIHKTFQAEVSRLLEIVTHSLYSEREIFLRELISNASDACDKLRYLALTSPEMLEDDSDYRIRIIADETAKTLTLIDNGIGMDKDGLINDLGTIARSGSAEFLKNISGNDKSDVSLIGQFGVGFYAAFMVADKVIVRTRKAGTSDGHEWESDGKGEFTIRPISDVPRGTTIVMHMRDDALEFLDEAKIKTIIKKYSEHITQPIFLGLPQEDDESQEAEKPVNSASALWTRPRAEITDEQYKEFYHHSAHAFDDPLFTFHWRAEGIIEYTGLLFIPTIRPMDLMMPERQHHTQLFVKRVFISDQADGLLPPWLRFLRGVIDSEDLPLNVSREMLQNNPVLAKIKRGVTKRILSELTKIAGSEEHTKDFKIFWDNYGAVLKEGLYEDLDFREELLGLLRFTTTKGELVSLKEYCDRMQDGQEAIFYITGDDVDKLKKSPQLEGFLSRDIEVLLLTDTVDEFWIPAVGGYEGKVIKSVTRGGDELSNIKQQDKPKDKQDQASKASDSDMGHLVAYLKLTLENQVKDVRVSDRLTQSAVCLVADEGDLDIRLERLLRAQNQLKDDFKRIMEVNADHPLIVKMAVLAKDKKDEAALKEVALSLFDQAMIIEGNSPSDPVAFGERLAKLMERTL